MAIERNENTSTKCYVAIRPEPWQFGLGSTLAELQLLAFTKVLAVGAFSGVRADGKRKGR